jgi:hypothetical protein
MGYRHNVRSHDSSTTRRRLSRREIDAQVYYGRDECRADLKIRITCYTIY